MNEWVFLSNRGTSFEWSLRVITRWEEKTRQWLNPRWPEFKMAAIIKLSENEWVSFFFFESDLGKCESLRGKTWSQIELVWVRVRMEWECFWVNLREDNKSSESKMAVSESNRAEFKMAAIIKLSQKESVKFFLCKIAESIMAEFKMAAIIKLSQNEWVWVRLN